MFLRSSIVLLGDDDDMMIMFGTIPVETTYSVQTYIASWVEFVVKLPSFTESD